MNHDYSSRYMSIKIISAFPGGKYLLNIGCPRQVHDRVMRSYGQLKGKNN